MQRHLLGDRHSCYPVENSDKAVTGLITLGRIRGVAPGMRTPTQIRETAIPHELIPTADPGEPVNALLSRLEWVDGDRELVVESGNVVGIVTARDIVRVIECAVSCCSPRRFDRYRNPLLAPTWSRAHDDHGSFRRLRDRRADGTEQHAGETTAAVAADDDELRPL